MAYIHIVHILHNILKSSPTALIASVVVKKCYSIKAYSEGHSNFCREYNRKESECEDWVVNRIVYCR